MQHHLWYCSAEISPLALTSSLLDPATKQMMANKIIEEAKTPNLKKGVIAMPRLEPGVTLVSRLGPQSLHFFVALKIGTAWLSKPVSLWDQIPAFQKLARLARKMPLSNAAAERMVKRIVDFANYGARALRVNKKILRPFRSKIFSGSTRTSKIL